MSDPDSQSTSELDNVDKTDRAPPLDIDGSPRAQNPTRAPHAPQNQRREYWLPSVMEARILDGYSYAQIANALPFDIAERTISRWVNRALEEKQEERKQLDKYMRQVFLEQMYEQKRQLQRTLQEVDNIIESQKASDEFASVEPSVLRERRQTLKEYRNTIESIRDLLGVDAPEKHQVDIETDIVWDVRPPAPEGVDEKALEAEVEQIEESDDE